MGSDRYGGFFWFVYIFFSIFIFLLAFISIFWLLLIAAIQNEQTKISDELKKNPRRKLFLGSQG